MRKSALALLGVIALPVVEIIALVLVASRIGVLPTLLLLVLASFAGMWLLRVRIATFGMAALSTLGANRSSVSTEVAGLTLALFGALLMLIPGLVTGTAGLALQIPWLRRRVAPHVSTGFTSVVGSVGSRVGRTDVIDVDEAPAPRSTSSPHELT